MTASQVERQNSIGEPSETTPLLGPDPDTEASTLVGSSTTPGSTSGSVTSGTPETTSPGGDASPPAEVRSKPLPKQQLFLLCYARMTEPIAFFCIFPFIAQMVQDNGHLPKSDVGFYSGLIESLFSATQMVVLVAWGRLADRIGRKPVLLYSLAGTAIGPALFGMSTSLWQMFLFRCLAGVFSGSGLIIRTMIAEISTPETQAQAFGWFAFFGNMGIFLGPILGGVLASPAEQYPRVFGKIQFFVDYPYALPGFVTGAIAATSFVACAFLLNETLKQKKGNGSETPEAQQDADEEPLLSTWELLKAPGVGVVLWIYGHVMFLAFAFTALIPVVLFTPVSLGGAGLTTPQISIFMAIQGGSQSAWMLLAFPALQKRLGTKGIMKACGNVYPFFFFSYIILSQLLRSGTHAAMVSFWTIGPIVAVVTPGVAMAFIAVQLALNDVSPSSHVLGTLNALALTLSSGIRALVPGATTAIYAIGVRGQVFGGHLAWVILIPLAAAFTVGCRYLPDKPAAKDSQDGENS
ncbi:major facilitator superfamily domain-containing protein [Thelonectria olida]|uniref:Major facilitator superfamily domain-containing protein n=1 Tax=Thelonectria olida TaxID=1576542 RepID=A0A9P8WF18_9HYPO|nr:major facilitator superfamily domain-containing protein [Thelonectria olida]